MHKHYFTIITVNFLTWKSSVDSIKVIRFYQWKVICMDSSNIWKFVAAEWVSQFKCFYNGERARSNEQILNLFVEYLEPFTKISIWNHLQDPNHLQRSVEICRPSRSALFFL